MLAKRAAKTSWRCWPRAKWGRSVALVLHQARRLLPGRGSCDGAGAFCQAAAPGKRWSSTMLYDALLLWYSASIGLDGFWMLLTFSLQKFCALCHAILLAAEQFRKADCGSKAAWYKQGAWFRSGTTLMPCHFMSFQSFEHSLPVSRRAYDCTCGRYCHACHPWSETEHELTWSLTIWHWQH